MWGFAVHPLRAVEEAPKYSLFFSGDLSEQADALIREIAQNSGDASVDPQTPVRLTFRFTTIDATLFRSRYIEPALKQRPSLREHMQAAGMSDTLLDGSDPVPLLVIEDFGTRGLTGAYDKNEKGSSFLGFWQKYGTSTKGDESGGRHGIGKSVVPDSSRIRTFFGVTRRVDDQKELLMGQVVLQPHTVAGRGYSTFGQFSPSGEEEFALPFEGSPVEEAKADFKLQRADQPGLSLVIPFPLPEITCDALIRAAVQHCFHQILSGHLTLQVDDAVLSRDTLITYVREHEPRLLAAAQLSYEATSKPPIRVFNTKAAVLRTSLNVGDFEPEVLESMRERFRAGDTVAVLLRVEIKPKVGDSMVGDVYLYLRRVSDAALARETYVRGRVTVPSQSRVLGGSSAVGLLLADHGSASKFLGDSEGVSHVKWVMKNLKEKYRSVEDSFRPIKYGLRNLQSVLTEEAEDRHIKDILKPFFWKPKPADGPAAGTPGTGDPPKKQPTLFCLAKTAGGFEVARDQGLPNTANAVVEVTYAVRRGGSKWSAPDFELAKTVQVIHTGDGVVGFEANRIRITDAGADFNMKVTGFDPNRDVLVRLVSSDSEGEGVIEDIDDAA